MIRTGRFLSFLIWLAAFVVSIYSVSRLIEMLRVVIAGGAGLTSALWLVGYSLATVFAITVLARGIYRLDRRAGRVRNKVGWFE